MKNKLLFLLLALVIAVSTIGGIYAFASDEAPEASETEEAPAPKASFYGATLVLSNTIQIRYIVRAENVADYNDISVLVWKTAQDEYVSGTEDYTLTYSGKTTNIGGGVKRPSFDFNGVGPQKLADDFYAVVALKTESGIEYSSPAKYGVLNYAYARFGKLGNAASTDENLVLLLEEMLDYGAASQKYTKYKTDRLATSDFYQIKTAGGKLPDGFTSGFYLEGEKVTLTATDKNAAGEVFICWADSEGNFLSQDNSIEITVANKNDTYTAVYGECIKHIFGDWFIDVEETCTETGLDKRVCTICGKAETNERAALGHSHDAVVTDPNCTEQGYTTHTCHCGDRYIDTYVDALGHRKYVTETGGATALVSATEEVIAKFLTCSSEVFCDVCDVVLADPIEHSYENSICSVCGYKCSPGLEYSYDSENNTYTVIGIGTCTDTNLYIPDKYNGAPVVAIGNRAFYDCDITSVTVPGSVTIIGEYAFSGCDLTSVTLEEGLITICEWAFDSPWLTSVTIPDTVKTIEANAFSSSCITLNIGKATPDIHPKVFVPFNGCFNVAEDNERYKSIDGSLYSKDGKTLFRFSGGSNAVLPDGLTRIAGGAFTLITELKSVVIPASVTTIDYAFDSCYSLTDIYYKGTEADWDAIVISSNDYYLLNAKRHYIVQYEAKAPTCTEAGYEAHEACECGSYSTRVDIPMLKHTFVSSVVTAPTCDKQGYTTHTCVYGHTYVDTYVDTIPHKVYATVTEETAVEIYKVTNDSKYPFTVSGNQIISTNKTDSTTSTYTITAERAFTLELQYKVSSESSFDWLKIYHNSIEKVKVSGQTSFTTISISMAVGDTVKISYSKDSMLSSGSDCAWVNIITEVYGTELREVEKIVDATDSVLANLIICAVDLKCEVCKNVVLEARGHNFVNGICSHCGELKGSEGLAYSYNSDTQTYAVTGIGTCTDTNIIIPSSYNGYPVTSIADSAFYYQHSLTGVTIPDSVTSIGSYAFYYCDSLASVALGNSVSVIESHAFGACKAITNIAIPSSVTTIGESAFYACYELKSIDFAENSKLMSIGEDAFESCSALADVYVRDIEAWLNVSFATNTSHPNYYGTLHFLNSNGVEIIDIVIPDGVTAINGWAFRNCSALISVTIPDSVTSIGHEAFSDCTSLQNVTIGDNVSSISSLAFYNCSALTSITIPAGVTRIDRHVFLNCTNLTKVIFVDYTTWYITEYGDYTRGTKIAVSNSSTNASYFKSSTYRSYLWYKE